jgi:hypothetical protein
MPFFPSATHFSFIVIFVISGVWTADELVVVCSAFVDIWPFVVCCVIKKEWPPLLLPVRNYSTAIRKPELIKESDTQSMESVPCPEISSDLQNLPKL